MVPMEGGSLQMYTQRTMRMFASLKGAGILHEFKNSSNFYFVFYNKTWVANLWLISWNLACGLFSYGPPAKNGFYIFKSCKKREEEEKEYATEIFMCFAKPKILLSGFL